MPNLKPEDGKPKKASFGTAIKTVLWSFVGIRQQGEHDKNATRLNPVHIVIAAVMAVAVFITVLILVVKSVVAK